MSAARFGRCGGCGKERDVDKQRGLLAVEAAWFKHDAARCSDDPRHPFYPLPDGMRRLAATRRDGRWFWACDECLKDRRAVRANPAKVTIGLGTPFAAYVDRPFRCGDCGVEAVFTAKEQLRWFEGLGFLIWVYPKQCPACRAKRRRRKLESKALADALKRLDPKDPAQLDAIAQLYEKLDSPKKAAEYRARAKNRRKARA